MNRATLVAAVASLGILIAGFASCSVNHRSGEFACTTQADCPSDRTCSEGLCISGGDPGIDAPPGIDGPVRPDAFVCPPQCTSCNPGAHECKVDCNASPATCNVPINCPAGFNCNIICTNLNSCPNINCTAGESCRIDCKGASSCKAITCGEGACDVKCEAANTCKNVNCNASCKCDVECPAANPGACSVLDCPKDGLTCANIGLPGCNSSNDGCDTCQ